MSWQTGFEAKIKKLTVLAAEHGAAIMAIRHCRAGWGILWWESARVKTKVPPGLLRDVYVPKDDPEYPTRVMENMREWERVHTATIAEGKVVYAYYLTASEAIEGELERLKELWHKKV